MIRRKGSPRRVGRRRRYGHPTTYTGRPLWASLLDAFKRGFTAGRSPQTPEQPDTRAVQPRKDPRA